MERKGDITEKGWLAGYEIESYTTWVVGD